VNPSEPPHAVREALGQGGLPSAGTAPGILLDQAADLLFRHSLFNGHPRFFGYITSSAAPIGALSDLLAASVNPNLGGWLLSPMACEIELQTIRWIAELIGYPSRCGGILTSGGNMANFLGFWAGRRHKLGADIRVTGTGSLLGKPRVYASGETHTWIQKATDLSGLGTDTIRWIGTDADQRMDVNALREAVARDMGAGDLPFLVVATAGSVMTGAVDPLRAIAEVCREYDLWLHADGAYGAPAAVLPDAPEELHHLALADSVAVDPHKWLYAPLEAGCTLVRDPALLRDTFSYHPPYYPDDDTRSEAPPVMFHEYGPQNSRGFRALKVWMGLRQAGREGYRQSIADDVRLARELHDLAAAHPELETEACGLSIATFRFVPRDLHLEGPEREAYLNELNKDLVENLQQGGIAFPSNAVIRGRYLVRACIVNFRTDRADLQALIDAAVTAGRALHAAQGPK
jgi:glutamate/tyrosine decarboxylase-like PLP-dependent enzyme